MTFVIQYKRQGRTNPAFSKPCLCLSNTCRFAIFVVFGGPRSEALVVSGQIPGRMQIHHFRQNGPFLAGDKDTVYQKHGLRHPERASVSVMFETNLKTI